MADSALAEAVRRKQVEDALNEEDQTDEEAGNSTDAESTQSTDDEQVSEAARPRERHQNDLSFSDYTGGVTSATQEQVPSTEPAPDTLQQVERAELVKLPATAPAPDTLPQVERAELVKSPEGAIELPAVTVTGELAPPVALASRELPKPPIGYGVAPRAELVDPDPDAQYLAATQAVAPTAKVTC